MFLFQPFKYLSSNLESYILGYPTTLLEDNSLPVFTRVIVDKRERASSIPRLLKALGLRVEYRMLAIGDYILSQGYVIERKEVNDFIRSLFSGRLLDQASRLAEGYDNAILIVEGDLQPIIEGLSNPRSVWGALATLAFNYRLHIFFTYNSQQTADFLYTLVKRVGLIKPERPIIYKKLRIRTSEEMKLAILSSLPGIGPKLAKNILEHFGSLREVFSSSIAELTLVDGIGRVKAERIVQILDSPQESTKEILEQTKLTKENE